MRELQMHNGEVRDAQDDCEDGHAWVPYYERGATEITEYQCRRCPATRDPEDL